MPFFIETICERRKTQNVSSLRFINVCPSSKEIPPQVNKSVHMNMFTLYTFFSFYSLSAHQAPSTITANNIKQPSFENQQKILNLYLCIYRQKKEKPK